MGGQLQGVVLDHSIAENIGYVNLAEIARGGWITSGRLNSFADGLIRQFGVKGRGSQNAGELSGGNQQKVVLAKWLARKPQVVVLDEPTRGIDVGARSSIYDLIMNLAKDGVAVVVVRWTWKRSWASRTASSSWPRASRPAFSTARTPTTSRSWNSRHSEQERPDV